VSSTCLPSSVPLINPGRKMLEDFTRHVCDRSPEARRLKGTGADRNSGNFGAPRARPSGFRKVPTIGSSMRNSSAPRGSCFSCSPAGVALRLSPDHKLSVSEYQEPPLHRHSTRRRRAATEQQNASKSLIYYGTGRGANPHDRKGRRILSPPLSLLNPCKSLNLHSFPHSALFDL